MASELEEINWRLSAIDAEIKPLAKTGADMQRLIEIPGDGRDLAAWLGLVPRQTTTGGKAKLIDTFSRNVQRLICASVIGASVW